MTADCTVIAAHRNSAADQVIREAGFLIDLSGDALTASLACAIDDEQAPAASVDAPNG